MSPERRTSRRNRPTRLSIELAEHINQRAADEWQERGNFDYEDDAVFEFNEGMLPRKAVEMKWVLEFLRATGRLRNAPGTKH